MEQIKARQKRQMNNRIKGLFLFTLFCLVGITPLVSEVLFTPRALDDLEGIMLLMDSWQALAADDPQSPTAAWLKRPGEKGYIGDIAVDFDNELMDSNGMRAGWDNTRRLFILHNRLREPYRSGVIAHEAGGHAYFDTRVPFIERILPPRYAVAINMIKEINAFLCEAVAAIRIEDRYTITETITERPPIESNAVMYFYKLRKYIADTRPGLSEWALWEAACNEFAMGFASHQPYINFAISVLPPQFYELMYVDNQYYTPPVLNRGSSHYMANLHIIIRKYLEAAMPPGVRLTLSPEAFLQEISRTIDVVDKVRAARNQQTCASIDSLFKKNMMMVLLLGSSIHDGAMTISPEEITWLDALVGPPKPNPNVLLNISSTLLYRDF